MSKEKRKINAFNEILEWSKLLPDWESDALRRIVENINYSENDVKEVLQLLKREKGFVSDEISSIKAMRLSKEHLPAHSEMSKKILLRSIYDVENVNAIVKGQKVEFLPDGLTIIYGRNAAGKSGYARILKKACRARGEKKPILPDVFSATDEKLIPCARIEIDDDGKSKTLFWKNGESFFDELGYISFFDSSCARVYIDEANEVSYIPYGLDVFEKLCDLLENLKAKLDDELSSISLDNSLLKEFPEKTATFDLLNRINYKTKTEEIESMAKIEKEDEIRLKELNENLTEIEKQSPKMKAESIRRKKRRVDSIKNDIYYVSTHMSNQEVNTIKDSHLAYIESEKAAEIASKATFKDEPLKGVGTNPWRVLFLAAKEYSEKYAYLGEEFPYLGDEARCVLCFQGLDSEALERFKKFKDFIKNQTTRIFEEKRGEFEEKSKNIPSIKEKIFKDHSDIIEEIKGINSENAESIENFFNQSKEILSKVEESIKRKTWNSIEGIGKFPLADLETICLNLEKQAKEYDAMEDSQKKKKLEGEYFELKSKIILRRNLDKVKKHINDLIKINKFEDCRKATTTTGISKKCSDLMESIVTERLKEEIVKEFKNLNIDYLKVDLNKMGRAGVTMHQLKLKSDKFQNINLSEVLSEGEQGSIAIATFLAELQVSNSCSGIVFDDPISSLDHPRRESAAKRLVHEASKKQTIIFTHDIVFLTALENEALKNGIAYKIQTIWSGPQGIGYCDSNAPWIGQNVNERIGYLKGHLLPKLEKLYSNIPLKKDEYEIRVTDYFEKIRETWERAVEEVVFNDAIQRFRDSVETNRLKAVKFHDEDYEKINEGMSLSSEFLHDRARTKGEEEIVDVSILKKEILNLEEFVDMKRKQLKDVRKQR